MRENPKPFEKFRHFKGNSYQVMTLAKDADTGEDLVVYQAMYGDFTVYVRGLDAFMSPVDKEKYPDASQEYRFERIGEASEAVETPKVEEAPETVETPKEEEAPEAIEVSKAEESPKADMDQASAEGESVLDPLVEEFLDTKEIEDKLNILAALHHKVTDDMLDILAAASDIELNEGSTEEKYKELKKCLLMTERYEGRRL